MSVISRSVSRPNIRRGMRGKFFGLVTEPVFEGDVIHIMQDGSIVIRDVLNGIVTLPDSYVTMRITDYSISQRAIETLASELDQSNLSARSVRDEYNRLIRDSLTGESNPSTLSTEQRDQLIKAALSFMLSASLV